MEFETLVWLVPLAVLALGLWQPRAGLVAFVATLPLFGSPPGGPYLAALDVAAVAAIATAWRGGRQRPSPISWAAAAFVTVSLLTLIPSPYLPPSWSPSVLFSLSKVFGGTEVWSALYTWRSAADLALGWGLFVSVRRAFDGRSLKPLAWALLSGLIVTLLLGLASFAEIVDLRDYRPLRYAQRSARRMTSIFFLSGWLSQFITIAAPFALAALATARGWRRNLTLPTISAIVACLILTRQRGSWVVLGAQLLLLATITLREHPRLRRLLRAAVAALTVSVLASGLVIGTGGSVETVAERARSVPAAVAGRAPLWSAASQMVLDRPVRGWGLGSFSPAYDLIHPVGSPGAHRYRGSAHSLYLQVLAERGLPGLLALALLGWGTAICLRRPPPGKEIYSAGLALSLAGATVYGLVQYLFHIRSIGFLLWILLGSVSVVTRLESAPATERLARALIVCALLIVPFRLFGASQPGFHDNRSFGFHQIEPGAAGAFRWTEGQAAQRIPWEGETLVLSLTNGHPRAGEHSVEVEIGLNGKALIQLSVGGEWEEHTIQVGPPEAEFVVLTLEASPTFRPFRDFRRYPGLASSFDIRSLGVAVKDIHWRD